MGNFRVFIFFAVLSVALTCALGASTSPETIFFRHYTKDGAHTDINIRNITLLVPKLNLTKLTMFYIHGFSETTDTNSVVLVTNALLTLDVNVVAIDYGQIAANNYLVLVGLAGSVAQALGQSFNKLEGSGLDPEKIHVVGHSFGGQLSGYLTLYLNFTLPRITGLDPAGPLFYTGRFLQASDAKFVEIIHTDKFFYGQPYNSGHANFLPNYGRRVQPGCPIVSKPLSDGEFCNHHRSYRFYAESVINQSGFLAVQCKDDFLFSVNVCNYTNIIPMGYGTPTNARGNFYLHTNSKSPFAKGIQGTRT